MPATTNVNFMTVVHKKSTGIAACFPDTCKTPTPGGPVPIPYPNIAMSSDAAKTTKKVKIDGEGVMVKGSNFRMSTGDEAGNAGGGIISNKFKGKAEFLNYSFDVKFEGKAAARLADPMGNNCGSPFNGPCPGEAQAPTAVLPGKKAGDLEACERLEKNKVADEDRGKVAMECGMHPDHAEAISAVCAGKPGRSATFRSTNPACLDKIKAGHPAKPMSIKNKTITNDRLQASSEATRNMASERNLHGLVGDYDADGRLRGVVTTDGVVPLERLGDSAPINAYTGDYDAHDMFGEGGRRILSGTPEEDGFIRDMNRAIDRDGGPTHDMVQHGPQANYSDYARANDIDPNPKLQVPDVSPEDPLLAFDENGNMYKLETEDELRDYYACKGEDPPKEWDDKEIRNKAGK